MLEAGTPDKRSRGKGEDKVSISFYLELEPLNGNYFNLEQKKKPVHILGIMYITVNEVHNRKRKNDLKIEN